MNFERETQAFLENHFACPFCNAEGAAPTLIKIGTWEWRCQQCKMWWQTEFKIQEMVFTDPLAAQKKARYKNNSDTCPYCDGQVRAANEEISGETAAITAQCITCRREWALQFKFKRLK